MNPPTPDLQDEFDLARQAMLRAWEALAKSGRASAVGPEETRLAMVKISATWEAVRHHAP